MLLSTAVFAQLPVSTFNASGTGRIGTVQHYVVPPCVTQVDIEAFGAQGGNSNGGAGARVKGRFAVTPGDTIYMAVGQQGTVNACGGAGASAGGGGGSFVWKSNGPARTLLLVAGGGGGGNANWPQACRDGIAAVLSAAGTAGVGTLSALGGSNGNGGFGNGSSGGGSGGAGWLSAGQNSTYGTGCTGGQTWPLFTGGTGSTLFGQAGQGDGGFGGGGGAVCGNGGGGGYSGGGGGEGNTCRAGGGGGGSFNSGTNQSNTANARSGNGQVIITPFLSSYSVNVQVWPSAAVCAGNAVTLTANNAATTQWSNNVINAVPFVPQSSNTYQLIATNSIGCVDTENVSLTVLPLPLVSIAASPGAQVCAGNMLTLNGMGASSYTWSGNVTNGVGFVPASSANYNVVGTSVNGCSASASISVTVNPLPTISFNAFPNDTVCAGDVVTLSGTGGSSYLWSNNILNNVPVVMFNSNNYIVTGSDINGCVQTATAQITVIPLPNVSIAAYNDTICAGDTVTLSGTGASVYTWSGGILNNVPFAPEASGEYIVTGTDVFGCVQTDTASLTVNQLPPVSFTATADTICAGDTVLLSGSGASSYTWSGGITNGQPFAPEAGGSYTLTGTDSNGCTATAQAEIVVHLLPVLSIATQPSASVCAGDSLLLSCAGAGNFVWNQNVINGVPFVPPFSQTYQVTVTDSNGCINTDSVFIAVNANPPFSLGPDLVLTSLPVNLNAGAGFAACLWNTGQNTFTISAPVAGTYWAMVTDSNGCTASDTIEIILTLGQNQLAAVPALSLYPNPSVGVLNLFSHALYTGTLTLEITDAAGRRVAATHFGEVSGTFTAQLDLSWLGSGNYFISVITDSGKWVQLWQKL